jgi:hypothetical protein
VWLLRKLAEFVDGVDLRQRHVGEAFDLLTAEAELLIAEGYARLDRRSQTDRRAIARNIADRRAQKAGRRLPRP